MADADWRLYKRIRGRDLPDSLSISLGDYRLEHIFKNDFYAATGVYCSDSADPPLRRVVYKVYHTDRWGPVPLGWMGRMLSRREARYFEALEDVPGVPRLLARVGESACVREHVAGENLREFHAHAKVDADFFPELERILAAVHAKGISHNDLSKPENMLVDERGRPVLIDFQISIMPARWPLGLGKLFGGVLRYLQGVDRYHLRKNQKRVRPDEMTPAMLAEAERRGLLLHFHFHLIRRPYRAVRHFVLRRFLMAEPQTAGAEKVERKRGSKAA